MSHFSVVRFVVILLVGAALMATPVFAQQVTLRGFVTDASNGQSLAGANVSLDDGAGGLLGAITDGEGFYQIPRIPAGTHVFTVSFVGYESHVDTLTLGAERFLTLSIALQPTAQALDEIVVSDERLGATALEAGRQRVRVEDVSRIPTPAAEGDLMGYLQTLPGVVTTGDRGGQLFIRGGTPSQNLVLVDGTMIYQPFHILGFFSDFPEDLIARADVYAGGYGARYSGRLSSVVDVSMRPGNNQRFEAAASASPFLNAVRVEGPLSRGLVSMIGSVRSSVIERTAPTFLGRELPLQFSDVYAKLQYAPSNMRCSATLMRTYDRGRIDAEAEDVFRWSNTALAGHCLAFSPTSPMVVEFNGGLTLFNNEVGEASDPERTADAWRINTELHVTQPVGQVELDWGFFGRADRISYVLGERLQGLAQDNSFLITTGAYLSTELKLSDYLELIPGLVATIPIDYGVSFEPRLRIAIRPWGTEAQQLNASVGIYNQLIEGITDERDAGSSFMVLMPAPLGSEQARSTHALVGWQQRLGVFGFSAESYYKKTTNLPVPVWSARARFTTALVAAEATTYGADVRLDVDRGPFYAYVGYGYTWTQYEASQANFMQWFGSPVQSYHPPHDRRHQLNAVASLDVDDFVFNVSWALGSGLPYTRPYGFDAFVHLLGMRDLRYFYGTPRVLYERPYNGRLPAYHRLDVSVERPFDLGAMRASVQAGAINVYDRANLFYFDVFTFRRVDQLPFVPYVSLKLETR